MHICGLMHKLTKFIDNEGNFGYSDSKILKSTNSTTVQKIVREWGTNMDTKLNEGAS